MQGVLAPAIEFWVFKSLGGLPSPIFGSVSGELTLPSKWGCDSYILKGGTRCKNEKTSQNSRTNLKRNKKNKVWKEERFVKGRIYPLCHPCVWVCSVSTKEHNCLKLWKKSNLNFFIMLKLFFVQKIKCQT